MLIIRCYKTHDQNHPVFILNRSSINYLPRFFYPLVA